MLPEDARGKLPWQCETPNTLVTKGDWDGDGVQNIVVFAICVSLDPIWSVWNGQGQRLFAMSFLPVPRTTPSSKNGFRRKAEACPSP